MISDDYRAANITIEQGLDAVRRFGPPGNGFTTSRSGVQVAPATGPCPFCAIVEGRAPATIVHRWSDALAIVPLGPVVDGHVLVIPTAHVRDASESPHITGRAMMCAAEIAKPPFNIITSAGREATQSVFHLHLHIVPRAENDGLALPWYSGKRKAGAK